MNDQYPTSWKRLAQRHPSLLKAIGLCCCLLLSAALGYSLKTHSDNNDSILRLEQQVPFDAYFSEQSFSEIENAKAKLRALGQEFITNVRAQHSLHPSASRQGPFYRNPAYAVHPERAMDELRWGIDQFQGTETESLLVRELLGLLKKQNLGDQWLDLYLDSVYRHPADPLIDLYAKDAAAIADYQQRQDELDDAFEFLHKIPAPPVQVLATSAAAAAEHPATVGFGFWKRARP
jgi:hypothetical protein